MAGKTPQQIYVNAGHAEINLPRCDDIDPICLVAAVADDSPSREVACLAFQKELADTPVTARRDKQQRSR
jgi:hypothetical protein